jgi:hypothetical protein
MSKIFIRLVCFQLFEPWHTVKGFILISVPWFCPTLSSETWIYGFRSTFFYSSFLTKDQLSFCDFLCGVYAFLRIMIYKPKDLWMSGGREDVRMITEIYGLRPGSNEIPHWKHSFLWCWNLEMSKNRSQISWKFGNLVLDRSLNNEVFRRVMGAKNILHTVKLRKANRQIKIKVNWFCPILRRNCILKHVIEWRIEGMRKRGRRRKQLLDDVREKRRNWELN